MHKVRLTYRVLADKLENQNDTACWIDWALQMIEAGFESGHLFILAGTSAQANRFEFDAIVEKTLKELSLDKFTREEIIQGYVYYWVSESLDGKLSIKLALDKLRSLCQRNDYDQEFMPFYLLAYAYMELEELGFQFYWEDADKHNIDKITRDLFTEWRLKYESVNKL